MANETPVIIRTRRGGDRPKQFNFNLEQVRLAGLGTALQTYRRQAWESFLALPLPDTSQEAWRRTDLRPLPVERFQLTPADPAALPPAPKSLLKPLADDVAAGQIILTPLGAQVQLAPELAEQGVIFTDLRTAETRHAGLLDRLVGQVVRADEGKFSALAAALAQNGVLLYVPRGVQVTQPLHSILWAPGQDLAHFSHVLVWLEEGAAATYIHESASPTEPAPALHAGIVEIQVGPAASLRFVELQSLGEHVWNFTHERARVDRDASLEWIFGAIGGHLTKNFSDLDLIGSGATGKMSGFYFTENEQHLDYDSQQNHLVPHTTSDLLFKGALLGSSRSVWQGMIYVAPGAAKTDGYQNNRNLVLSRQARADSIPGLEILADDVRCTHGATVGKIDPEQIFYLQARGVPRREAERLIVEGFFDPIMQRIPFEGVRARFQEAIHDKMNTYASV
ncbi:MAG TPA: Fe-S cluster assembly protein SufD [Anaerolineaceae bacterium]|jgi:Fe-S cluster assembly protein SufD|nr:Fe-S cluster assembly protein SufD [Anaerolineaceae bacterium]